MTALVDISRTLAENVDALQFALPVSHVYNPLIYARQPHEEYLRRYGDKKKEIILLGMNPGPFGMTQTGIPFGDVVMVRDWLSINTPVARPANEHHKRPIEGFDCRRREVSGSRLWGWAKEYWKTPEQFFARFFVLNYCPLVFMEESGKNLTPDRLAVSERQQLFSYCDSALRQTIELLAPRYAIGIGDFAMKRLQAVLPDSTITIASILHPSPANPQANRGWGEQVNAKLTELDIL